MAFCGVLTRPSPLASYHTLPDMSEGVSLREVGRDVGSGVMEKGLVYIMLLLLPMLEELLLLLDDEAPLLLLELEPELSKLGLQGNPSSNFSQACVHLLPSPGGLYPKNVGELQYGWTRHSYQSLYNRTKDPSAKSGCCKCVGTE